MTSSSDPLGEGDEQKEYLLSPDPTRPDFVFLDDENTVCIQTWPAATPVWIDYGGTGNGLATFVTGAAILSIAARIDRRWKVVTFRQPRRRPSIPRVIGLEFCDGEEAADARRAELLRTWRSGDSVGRPAIKAGARGRARRRARG